MAAADDSAEIERLIRDAASGDQGAWRGLVAAFGPVVRGYLRAVGDPDVDGELAEVFAVVLDDLEAYAPTADELVISLFDVAIDRQRRVRRPVVAPDRTEYSTPGLELEPDIRDALLLDRLAGLGVVDSAQVLSAPRSVVEAWRGQGSEQIADDNWGRG